METKDPPQSTITELEQNVQQPVPQSQSDYFGWFKSTLSQSAEVWGQIKQDISEVAQTVMANKQIAAAERTAASVYKQISEAVQQSLQDEAPSSEPPPPPEPDEETQTAGGDADEEEEEPIAALKSTLSGMVSAFERGLNDLTGGSLFKIPSTGRAAGDNRQARIDVIRADPATFEEVPDADATTTKGVLPYTDWRHKYFNEKDCCPLAGMPIFDGQLAPDTSFPTPPSQPIPDPARVLEESPAVRKQLLRLVDPDSREGLSEGDFWSRYYYRVWCLDVLELRRQRLAGEEKGSDAVNKADQVEDMESWPALEVDEETEGEAPPDEESSSELDQPSGENSSRRSSVVVVDDGGKEAPRYGKKSTDSDHASLPKQKSDWDDGECENGDDDEEDDDDAIQLTEEDLKAAETEMKAQFKSEDATSEGSDWEKWS